MLTLGAIGFTAPWVLTAFVLVPAIWWLLRIVPPTPRRVVFPPVRLLQKVASGDETSRRTPWWIIVLRLLLVICIILGIARPVLNVGAAFIGSGPVYLMIDDGWSAARSWSERLAAFEQVIDQAERERRPVVILPTAPPLPDAAAGLLTALPPASARERVRTVQPKPWTSDAGSAVLFLQKWADAQAMPPGEVVWISDGLEQPGGLAATTILFEHLRKLGHVTMILPQRHDLPVLIKPADIRGGGRAFLAVRADAERAVALSLRLLDGEGVPLGRQPIEFEPDQSSRRVELDLPAELAQRLVRIEIEGIDAAAAVFLTDERWQRRAIGLVGEPAAGDQPLLSPNYYVERALQPFAEIRYGEIGQLLDRPLAMLVLTDVGTLDAETAQRVEQWVQAGGVLLRFAGPHLGQVSSGSDPLLPVVLRAGDRTMGGALSWTGAGRIAAFEPSSPLRDLPVPADIEIRRQVIAEPSVDIAQRTWARLDDGTSLITGVQRGTGWIVLVHTSASPDWSTFPLSGTFVEVLRRITELAGPGRQQADLPLLVPLEVLDGFGRLQSAPPSARAIPREALSTITVGPQHPPGFYGGKDVKQALNLGPNVAEPRRLQSLPASVHVLSLGGNQQRDLQSWLLGAAVLLSVIDGIISLWFRGSFATRSRLAGRLAVGGVLMACVCGAPSLSRADSGHLQAVIDPASLSMRLAYLQTGDAGIDQISEAGLAGLSTQVNRRTAAELDRPAGINPETDELAFYPLLYWPVVDGQRTLSSGAVRRLKEYMRRGGTIVFDTRGRASHSEQADLRELARLLDLPPLVPLSADHVLRRSYYLLSDIPGRRSGGTVWVEDAAERVNDGVSSVVAGSGDWVGAWATDEMQRPLFAVVPGGERQRELAFRFGVNLVMYVLTGNYKADQVHLPAILERLSP